MPMSDPWALYIDVEGFASKWNETDMEAFRGINTLMEGIFRIGTHCYAEPPARLFAHQFGDAFLVVSDSHETLFDRAALVGIALMRQLLSVGEATKCAMDEGHISDIANCYPDPIRKRYNQGHIDVGAGLMTFTPVMGTALIRTASLQKRVHGPLFVLRKSLSDRLSTTFRLSELPDPDLLSLNWVSGEPPGLNKLQEMAGLSHIAEEDRREQLRSYIERNSGLGHEWRENVRTYLLADGA
jgi:hypothetical protein